MKSRNSMSEYAESIYKTFSIPPINIDIHSISIYLKLLHLFF